MSERFAQYVFGDYRLEPEKKRLWRRDELVHLTPKTLEILTVLVRNHGRTVSRTELLEAVWKDTYIEEGNINFNISLLRKALASSGPPLIKTIPKEGYRFVEDVTEISGDTAHVESAKDSGQAYRDTVRSGLRWQFVGFFLLFGVVAAAGGLWWGLSSGRALAANGEPRPITSIAVLPLRSLSGDPNDLPLSLGFADALITSLGQLEQTRVISTGAVSKLETVEKSPAEIGRKFGVDSILEGSFQKANGKLRVMLRLFRTSDGTQLWSGSFDESESEVFHLQEVMATETARVLKATFRPPTGAARRMTDNVEAYNLFLKGNYLFRRRGAENDRKASEFFNQAVHLDPKFARAWAGLAGSSAMLADTSIAEKAAERALEIDPTLSEAHAVRGFIRMFHYWDWETAEKELERAIELDPNAVEAHHWRGVLYSFHGRLDEAKAEMQKALEIDPLSLNLLSDIAQLYYLSREYDKAEKQLMDAMAIDPEYPAAHGYLLSVYRGQGRADEAFAKEVYTTCAHAKADKSKFAKCESEEVSLYKKVGHKKYRLLELEKLSESLARGRLKPDALSAVYYQCGVLNMELGNKPAAVENFNKSLDTKQPFEIMNFTFPYIKVDPRYDSMRLEPAFQELLKRLRLD